MSQRAARTVCESRTVKQFKFQQRKKASWRVNCRCSTSTISSISSSSSGIGVTSTLEGSEAGLQVAADGIEGPERAGTITRPSVAKIVSASWATAAIARARSSLNCRRSSLRLVVTSSEVSSERQVNKKTCGLRKGIFLKELTFPCALSDIYLPR